MDTESSEPSIDSTLPWPTRIRPADFWSPQFPILAFLVAQDLDSPTEDKDALLKDFVSGPNPRRYWQWYQNEDTGEIEGYGMAEIVGSALWLTFARYWGKDKTLTKRALEDAIRWAEPHGVTSVLQMSTRPRRCSTFGFRPVKTYYLRSAT